MYGYDPAQYTTQELSYADQIHPDDLAQVFSEVTLASKGEKDSFSHKPYRYRAKSGAYHWVSDNTTIVRNKEGAISHYIGYLTDITEHVETQNLLKQKEKALQNLFELSPVGIALNKLSGEFLELNSALHTMCGYTCEEFKNLSYWDITPRSYEEEELTQLEKLKKQGSYGPYKKEYIHKDGHRIHVLLSGVKIQNDAGGECIWSIVEDITELTNSYEMLQVNNEKFQELNIQLQKEKEHAEFTNKSKSRFLANMSHEIRTPMNAILGFVDILQKSEVDEKRKEHFSYIRNSSQLLLSIVNDILDISKIESGKLSIAPTATDSKHLLESILGVYQSICNDKAIAFQYHVDDALPATLLIDAVRVKQVILNILSNAVKFTPQNGNVSLHIWYDKKREVLFCDVKDTGIGIAAGNLDKVFNAFEQEDASTTRKFGGTGLGLSISSSLIKMMGGEITVQSCLGEGSCFSFFMDAPLYEEQTLDETQQVLTLKKKINLDIKVLIVEDNRTNQKLLGFFLDDLDIEYAIAEDGLEAIECFKTKEYDIILMDENMPNMNGIEATKVIRMLEEEQALEPIVIIAVTANAFTGDRERFLNAQMNDYISKPYTDEDIENIFLKYF